MIPSLVALVLGVVAGMALLFRAIANAVSEEDQKRIVRLEDRLASSEAERSALEDQLKRAKNTPWVRCVGCKQMVEEQNAVEQSMGVWECSECGDFFCNACGSLECPDCGHCIRGCPWAAKINEVCKCADKIDQSSPAGSQ